MFFQFAFLSAPVPVSVLSYITTSVSYPYPEKIAVSVNIHPPMHAYPRASSCRCSESESETIFVGMFVITVISYHRQGGYKAVVICKIQNYTCNHGLIRLHFFVFCCFRSVKLRLHLTTGCTVVYNRRPIQPVQYVHANPTMTCSVFHSNHGRKMRCFCRTAIQMTSVGRMR